MTTYALPIPEALAEQIAALSPDELPEVNETVAAYLAQVVSGRETESVDDEPLDDETLELLKQRIADEDAGGPVLTLDEVEANIRTALANRRVKA